MTVREWFRSHQVTAASLCSTVDQTPSELGCWTLRKETALFSGIMGLGWPGLHDAHLARTGRPLRWV